MKIHSQFLTIWLLLPCIAAGQSPIPLSEANLQQSVFQVRVEKTIPPKEKAPGFRGEEDLERHYQSLMAAAGKQGTGFIISHQGRPLVVTNYHVVWLADTDFAGSIQAVTSDGRGLALKLEDYDPYYDLAILSFYQADVPIPQPLELALEIPDTGMPVIAAGFPKGVWAMTTGNFEGWTVHPATGRSDMLGHQAKIDYGNSGGPLLDTDGRVLGVNVIKNLDQGPNLALPSANIERLLQTIGQPHRRCYLGVELRENQEGVYLKEVMPNSPADEKGHTYRGWKLTAINGKEVNDLSGALRLLEAMRPGQHISLLLRNPATEREEAITFPSEALDSLHLEALGKYVLDSFGYQDDNYSWKPNIMKFKPNTQWKNGSGTFGKKPYLITLVGHDPKLPRETAWATPTLYDLGVAIRLSAFDGEIGLWLQDASNPQGMPYQASFEFTGEDNLREKVLFY